MASDGAAYAFDLRIAPPSGTVWPMPTAPVIPAPPARYCIRADLVKPEFLVEIASTAHLGR
jgi:hypothetical protein